MMIGSAWHSLAFTGVVLDRIKSNIIVPSLALTEELVVSTQSTDGSEWHKRRQICETVEKLVNRVLGQWYSSAKKFENRCAKHYLKPLTSATTDEGDNDEEERSQPGVP